MNTLVHHTPGYAYCMHRLLDAHDCTVPHIGVHDGSESVDSVWITPDQALKDAEAGTRTIIFPTRMNIEKLAGSADVDEALASCGGVVTVKPFIEQDGDKRFLRIQANAGYGDPREDITNGM